MVTPSSKMPMRLAKETRLVRQNDRVSKGGEKYRRSQLHMLCPRGYGGECRQCFQAGACEHAVTDPDGPKAERLGLLCQVDDLTEVRSPLGHDDFTRREQ
jgi:hypothetical protein